MRITNPSPYTTDWTLTRICPQCAAELEIEFDDIAISHYPETWQDEDGYTVSTTCIGCGHSFPLYTTFSKQQLRYWYTMKNERKLS